VSKVGKNTPLNVPNLRAPARGEVCLSQIDFSEDVILVILIPRDSYGNSGQKNGSTASVISNVTIVNGIPTFR
jgi:hypothetical protein